jgi:NDP-4-keto-2,6-dideoxyhexose 3-C-methyltransferase
MNDMVYSSVACLISGRDDVHPVLDFGSLPVAGYLCDTREEAVRAPRFRHCMGIGQISGHVQQFDRSARQFLANTVYRDYQPTYSRSRVVSDYLARFVAYAASIAGARSGDTMLEIGCNDGSGLMAAHSQGFSAVGFDPSAARLAAENKDVEIVAEFFTADTASRWQRGRQRPRAVFTRHTLEHSDNPVEFLSTAKSIVDPEGAILIEVPYLRLQLQGNHFEGMSVQHESVFSVTSMLKCLEAAELEAISIRLVPLDGGSMVVAARPRRQGHEADWNAEIAALLGVEKDEGLATSAGLDRFATRFSAFTQQTQEFLRRTTAAGRRVVAYGAGSKGHQLLNVLKADSEMVSFVIDDTAGKPGKFVPGCAIPVISQREAVELRPDVVLVTAPTHVREVFNNSQALRERGAVFFATTPCFGPVVTETLAL